MKLLLWLSSCLFFAFSPHTQANIVYDSTHLTRVQQQRIEAASHTKSVFKQKIKRQPKSQQQQQKQEQVLTLALFIIGLSIILGGTILFILSIALLISWSWWTGLLVVLGGFGLTVLLFLLDPADLLPYFLSLCIGLAIVSLGFLIAGFITGLLAFYIAAAAFIIPFLVTVFIVLRMSHVI